MKNVLILAFYYPPMIRVGGRRWHLFAKYMQRIGINVHVLTCDKEDVDLAQQENEAQLHFVPNPGKSQLPYYKRSLPQNLAERLVWHVSKRGDQLWKSFVDHDHYDLSIAAIDAFAFKAKTVISTEQIDTVILTVGPFAYSAVLTELKRRFPEVKFVLDYRDDWFLDRPELSEKQKRGELKRESLALKSADMVSTVDENIATALAQRHPRMKTPIRVIPHGYDEEEFAGLEYKPLKTTAASGLKLVYGGACYYGVEKYYGYFRELLALNSHVNITADFFFTYLSDEVENVLADIQGTQIHGPVTRREMLAIHSNASDINLIIYPDKSFDAKTSKFFELIRCGKPIWYFGPDGPTANFIRSNTLGRTFCKPEDLQQLNGDAIFRESHTGSQHPTFDLKNHSIPRILDTLLAEIKKL